jgi:hypothetical protein
MTHLEYIAYFEAKAEKIGHIPNGKIRRFADYINDGMFLPDISKFNLDLSEMCLLIGQYDFNIGGSLNRGNEPLTYQASAMFVKTAPLNDWYAEQLIMSEAEQYAINLYNAARKEVCDDSFGYWFAKTKISERPWTVSKIKLGHDNIVGVQVQFSFYVNTKFQSGITDNVFLT